MEANRKHSALTKWRLNMSLYCATKAGVRTTSQYNTKPEPTFIAAKYTNINKEKVGYIVKNNYTTPQPKQKVAIAPTEYDYNQKFESYYGDESIDLKAASYISSVQERFKLDRVNSERKMAQDMNNQVKD